MLNPKHTLSRLGLRRSLGGRERAAARGGRRRAGSDARSTPRSRTAATTSSATGTASCSAIWFVEGTVAHHQDEFKETPARAVSPGDRQSAGQCPLRYGGVGFFEDATSTNTQYQLKFSNFLQAAGEHNVRYGVIYQDIGYTRRPTTRAPTESGSAWRDRTRSGETRTTPTRSLPAAIRGTSTRPDRASGSTASAAAQLGAETKTRYTAAFISDTWNPTKYLSVMAGIRNEQEKLKAT